MKNCDKAEEYLDPSLDAKMRDELEAHFRDCAECEARLENWGLALDRISARAEVSPREPSEEFAERLVAIAAQRSGTERSNTSVRSSRPYLVPVAIAAGALLIATGVLVYLSVSRPDGRTDQQIGEGAIVWKRVVGGSEEGGVLAAGSVVSSGEEEVTVFSSETDRLTLSRSSSMKLVGASQEGTTVRLTRGEIFCAISRQAASKRFAVQAGEYTVIVVGTRFSVSTNDSGVMVRVEEGVVRVEGGEGQERILGAGDVFDSLREEEGDSNIVEERAEREETEATQAEERSRDAGPRKDKAVSADEPKEREDLSSLRDWIIEGRIAEAKEVLGALLEAKGPGTEALLLLSDCHRKEGDFSAALEALDGALAHAASGQKGKIIFMSAVLVQDKMNDPEGAGARFERYLDEGGTKLEGPAMLRLARAYAETGDTVKAEKVLETVVARFDGTPIARRAVQLLEKMKGSSGEDSGREEANED